MLTELNLGSVVLLLVPGGVQEKKSPSVYNNITSLVPNSVVTPAATTRPSMVCVRSRPNSKEGLLPPMVVEEISFPAMSVTKK